MEEHYYKFRSLQNLKFFIDIILNERLWAAKYTDLNDPMEGAYMTDIDHRYLIDLLKSEKDKTRICSLSKCYNDNRMWAYYGDSHQGCCIEVSLKNQREKPKDVNYIEKLPQVYQVKSGCELLLHKSSQWKYEQEVRVFRKAKYVKIQIHRIIFGLKVSEADYLFHKRIINQLNPSIQVCQIQENEIDDVFNN